MPIYIPEEKIKVKCQKCGSEVSAKIGGYGDCPTNIEEMSRFARDIFLFENLRCPKS